MSIGVLEGALIGGAVGLAVGVAISIPNMIRQSKINKGQTVAKPGKRFQQVIPFTGDYQAVEKRLDEYLTANNFVQQPYGEETLYRYGKGMWSASQFIKFNQTPEGVQVEAFIVNFGSREDDLQGFVGSIPKKSLQKTVDRVITLIQAKDTGLKPDAEDQKEETDGEV